MKRHRTWVVILSLQGPACFTFLYYNISDLNKWVNNGNFFSRTFRKSNSTKYSGILDQIKTFKIAALEDTEKGTNVTIR